MQQTENILFQKIKRWRNKWVRPSC